ncbi:hypothetical protein I0C86_28490 [Plantactinospora sp. S1510]|uniref:DUF4034 domain-containing protein n=1 Tax=Plantactinospora alkalitolerans TaxID=2789879 RepID=A0ABS0H417_9ACTN|nr:hypothetical protein [Plantactinospora alkalitolerans]MBF9132867.1 hypothetical protein [Plantactinospora alkalitolerans]
MFSRIFRREPGEPRLTPPVLDTDIALDDHAVRHARDRARAGDWTAARDVVAVAGTDWELRSRRISVLSDAAVENDAWLYAWLRSSPDDPTAVTIYAEVLGVRAGDARGDAPASRTSPEQFRAFAELSDAAATASRRAIALAGPDDPTPYVELLGAAFADGQVDSPEFQEALAEAKRRDPYNFDLHVTMVSLLCQKWFGSHEQMFGAAREVAGAAPPGANVVVVPFLAHFEYAMREYGWDQRTPESLAACSRHFQRPEVQRELDTWAAKWRAGPHGPARAMTCRHWLALAYFLARRRAETKAALDEIGPYLGPTLAWAYFFPSTEAGFLTAWRWANT